MLPPRTGQDERRRSPTPSRHPTIPERSRRSRGACRGAWRRHPLEAPVLLGYRGGHSKLHSVCCWAIKRRSVVGVDNSPNRGNQHMYRYNLHDCLLAAAKLFTLMFNWKPITMYHVLEKFSTVLIDGRLSAC